MQVCIIIITNAEIRVTLSLNNISAALWRALSTIL